MAITWEEWIAREVYAMWCKENSRHVQYVCTTQHEDGGYSCMFCGGGLFACSRCGAFEGATPSECPGIKMTTEQSDRVYDCIIDFRFGQWVSGGCVTMYRPLPPAPPAGYTWDWDDVYQQISVFEYEPTVVDA